MYQPEGLRTDEYLPWSRGRGNDVWAMLRSAADGDIATLQALIAREPSLVDCGYQYYRPLFFAVRSNQLEAVRLLLDAGAGPMCDGLGYQPSYRPKNPSNLPWPPTMARERGYVEIAALLDATLWTRFQIAPDGVLLPEPIRARDAAEVGRLLDARPELLHMADGFGNKPIHWAVMTRQMPLIDLLLARGADIEAMRPDNAKPIDLTNGDYHYRGWRDVPRWLIRPHEVLIGYLIARGAYYDISTAAQLGDLERVRALLDERPERANELPTSSDYYNGVPLRCAAKGGHLEVVRLLLERGADPNRPEAVAPFGGALYEAIGGKHWEIVKLLLAHGANASGHVESSGNCYWRAKRDGAPAEILKLLASHGGMLDAELASYDGDIEALALMLTANPQLCVYEHMSTDDEEVLRLVMRFQPSVLSKKSFNGAKSVEHARWLLDHGIDPRTPNWLGVTPLHRLAIEGKIEMAALCLEYGAEIDPIDDEYSSTPLGWAARAGRKEMLEWLLERGANANAPADIAWAQPLAWAELFGHAEVADVLRQALKV